MSSGQVDTEAQLDQATKATQTAKSWPTAVIVEPIMSYFSTRGQLTNEFVRLLAAEFLGTLLFQIFGGAAAGAVAAPANGFALAVILYITGAHLNPAVSLALRLTGHQSSWWKTLAEMLAQVAGAIFGSLIYSGLVPGLKVGESSFQGGNAPGCFGPAPGVSKGELFGWEVVLTFLLVITVYATAVTKAGDVPSAKDIAAGKADKHVDYKKMAPLAIGLSLFVAALTGGPYTGASLNPARVLGPAFTFACNLDVFYIYILAEFLGAALAAATAVLFFGAAPTKEESPKDDTV